MPVSFYHDDILELKRAHSELGWFQSLFYPDELALELNSYPEYNPTNQDKLNIFKTFEEYTSFSHRWFFKSLRKFYKNSYTEALRALQTTNLLTGNTAQANFNAVDEHRYPHYVAEALCILNRAGLLINDTVQANRDAVVTHFDPRPVARALCHLNSGGLLTGDAAQANFNAVVAHQSPDDVAQALYTLNSAGLLTGDAAQANFNAVVAHQSPGDVARALYTLNSAGLLKGDAAQANFNAVVTHQSPRGVAEALRIFSSADLLRGDAAQANFNSLVITQTAILLHPNNNQDGVNLWNIMPYGRPTATEFQAMITIAQNHADNPDAGSVALRAYVYTHILGMNRQQRAFNPNQSTHTASVHASVSQSATKLLNRYSSNIAGHALDTAVQYFISSVHEHSPHDYKQQAAARCIIRLMNPYYPYIDSVSQVSLKQLIALVRIAIHDETARIGTLFDAKQQLIEGLYEIQRGGNLSETGVDDNAPEDRPICTAGTFNKLIEKLAGLHPDVSVLYITKTGATAKLRIVAVEEAQNYLNTLVFGTEEYLMLQNNFSDDNMQPLWDIIAPQVANRLFEEFGSLYPEGRTSPDFVNCVAQGIYALTSDTLVLPTTPRNQTSVATNPHVLFQPNEDDDLNATQVEATLNLDSCQRD